MKVYNLETIQDMFQLTDKDMEFFKDVAKQVFFSGKEQSDQEFLVIVKEEIKKLSLTSIMTLAVHGFITKEYKLQLLGTLILAHVRNSLSNN